MDLNTILVPADFSHSDKVALQLASSLARDTGARLLIIHVAEVPTYYGGEMYYGLPDPDTAALKRMLFDIVPADGIPYEHHLLTGEPAPSIVRFAQEHDVDMIVMSTHGRTGFSRLLMGSIAEAVVRKAQCPVLTLKPSAEAAEKVS